MKLELQQATLMLTAGRLIKLHAGRGTRVRCLAGTIWVTQEGEPRDAFLTRGKGMVVRSPDLTVVESLGDATVALKAGDADNAHARWRRWLRWVPYY